MEKKIRIACKGATALDLEEFHEFQGELKTLSKPDYERLKKEIDANGFSFAVHVWKNKGKHFILDGHQRLRTVKQMVAEGYRCPAIPISIVDADSLKQAKHKLLAAASQYGQVTGQGLYEFMHEAGFEQAELESFRFPEIDFEKFSAEFFKDIVGEPEPEPTKLSDNFIVPPFSVFDQRQGYWKARKEQWLALGIQSELGRGKNLLKMSDTMLQPDPSKRVWQPANAHLTKEQQDSLGFYAAYGGAGAIDRGDGGALGTSIFDPVLCEILYRWLSPQGGVILDPFAGGSVRGVVASKLGRSYFGVDLRKEQVDENTSQAHNLCASQKPQWKAGDSLDIKKLWKGLAADFLFSCPPYADLEVYSEDPKDLSTMSYPDFMKAYEKIISEAAAMLKPDRFACFVVSEVRDKKGNCRGFVPDTIKAFEAAGLKLYNEAVLVGPVGTAALRAGRYLTSGRKFARVHQNVLIFVKGSWKKAVEACGPISIDGLGEMLQEAMGGHAAAIDPLLLEGKE
jgi:hypothetical protein